MQLEAESRFRPSTWPGRGSGPWRRTTWPRPLATARPSWTTEILLGRIDIIDGKYESGMRDGMRAAREARDAGFESVGGHGYRNPAVLAARIMDPQAAGLAIGEGLQYADAIEQSHCRQMIAGTLALLEWGAGHWDAADARARQDLSDRGCQRGMIGGQDVIGLVAMGQGGRMRPAVGSRESLAVGRRIGEVHLILTPLWGLAERNCLRAVRRLPQAL